MLQQCRASEPSWFNPRKLIANLDQSTQVAAHAFVGIDGYRSLSLFGLLLIMAAFGRNTDFIHDALISMRKFYSEPELAFIAGLAAPSRPVRTFSLVPGYSAIEIGCG